MTDYSYMERSTIFEYYVEAFPNSMIGKEFRRNGLRSIETAGTFRTALYEGDLDKALLYADRNNQIRLMLVLKDRKGYPIQIEGKDKEIRSYLNKEEESGEREMHWGEIMEEIRENGAYEE